MNAGLIIAMVLGTAGTVYMVGKMGNGAAGQVAGQPTAPAAPPTQPTGYQGKTGDNAYSMLGSAFEGIGNVAASWIGSGFNSGTREGGVYGGGGDFYGWDY